MPARLSGVDSSWLGPVGFPLRAVFISPVKLGETPPTQALVARVLAAAPGALVVTSFLSPTDLAPLFRRTLLNVHSAMYEAFGMTAVEAAAFGAPTLFHSAGLVGAGLRPPVPADLVPLRRHAERRQPRSGRCSPIPERLPPQAHAHQALPRCSGQRLGSQSFWT